ncbi:MAG TPA: hypothetical protein HA230_02710 [Candidatus Aenigmarchaeota archaeon]|nr:hypothetical protein [Candidatus Aenigmarchaeota archaeon]
MYQGKERRSRTEFCFSMDNPDYGRLVTAETRLTFFTNPFFYEFFEKRTEGMKGRHFIPLRGQEPSDIESSGHLVPISIGGLPKNHAGQVSSDEISMALSYDPITEKYFQTAE